MTNSRQGLGPTVRSPPGTLAVTREQHGRRAPTRPHPENVM